MKLGIVLLILLLGSFLEYSNGKHKNSKKQNNNSNRVSRRKPQRPQKVEMEDLDNIGDPSRPHKAANRCFSSSGQKLQRFCRNNFQCCNGEICEPKEKICVVLGTAKVGQACQRSTDCAGQLTCLNERCDSMGREGDPCKMQTECRSNLYCSTTLNSCRKRYTLGEKCLMNYHCINSICIPQQLQTGRPEPPRRRRQPPPQRYCSVVSRGKGQNCKPRQEHCMDGLSCTQIARRQYKCKPLTMLESGDRCRNSRQCRCGEYCSKKAVCKAAVCKTATGPICSNYKGLSHRFQCKNGMCMPPQDLWSRAFGNRRRLGSANNTSITSITRPNGGVIFG